MPHSLADVVFNVRCIGCAHALCPSILGSRVCSRLQDDGSAPIRSAARDHAGRRGGDGGGMHQEGSPHRVAALLARTGRAAAWLRQRPSPRSASPPCSSACRAPPPAGWGPGTTWCGAHACPTPPEDASPIAPSSPVPTASTARALRATLGIPGVGHAGHAAHGALERCRRGPGRTGPSRGCARRPREARATAGVFRASGAGEAGGGCGRGPAGMHARRLPGYPPLGSQAWSQRWRRRQRSAGAASPRRRVGRTESAAAGAGPGRLLPLQVPRAGHAQSSGLWDTPPAGQPGGQPGAGSRAPRRLQ